MVRNQPIGIRYPPMDLKMISVNYLKKTMDDEDSTPSFLVQRRSKKNRQTKTQLVFDEQARK